MHLRTPRSWAVLYTVLSLVLIWAGLSPVTAAAETECCYYRVDGFVFNDHNGDGIWNGSDYGLANWIVEATDSTGTTVTVVETTDASGYYLFDPGPSFCGVKFNLREVVQNGWSQTFPVSPNYHQATLGSCSGQIFGPYNFGNQVSCNPFQKTYTLDAEFQTGTLNGVVASSDQLQLTTTGSTYEYAWIANAGEGSISKVSTVTGNEVARYYTGPPDINGYYTYLNPSRTVVDADGNCWVANRTFNGLPSITQILAEGGSDFNTNTIIETSADNITINGMIDPSEIKPWGQDERVVRHYAIGTANPNEARAFAIDKKGFLWVGLSTELRLAKLDPNLPISVYGSNQPQTVAPELASLNVGHYPYGLALSPNGFLYLSTLSEYALEIDPGIASGGISAVPTITQSIQHVGQMNYGIAVDQDCIVWLAKLTSTVGDGCIRWDPTASWANSTVGAPGSGRGITVDFTGDIWMACNDFNNSVARYDNLGNFISSHPTGSPIPVGIGVASDGNIIVTPNAGSFWEKLSQINGLPIALAGPQLAGPYPYTYSDFTGSLQNITSQQQGFWNAITDGGWNGLVWNVVTWNGSTPPGTSVQVEARTAQTLPALAAEPWTLLTVSGPLSPLMAGRYIENRVRLQREIECGQPFVTPILFDLTVEAICDTCFLDGCEDLAVDCDDGNGAIVTYLAPSLGGNCDSTYVVTCSPPSGSLFPIGQTAVNCIAINAGNDTLTCSFSITVGDECFDPPMGACCVGDLCVITTEHDCNVQNGLYLGDGSDCTQGCDVVCVRPPHNMIAWWPLDMEISGVTPNLADPAANGTLINTPAPVTGQYVNNAYDFNGTTQYVNAPHAPSLNVGSGDLSMDVWVKTPQSTGFNPIVDKRETTGPVQGYQFYLADGYPGLQLAQGGSFTNHFLNAGNGGAPAFVGDDQWHHVAVTVDRNQANGIRFYVDGSPVGTTLNPTPDQGNLDNTSALWIGRGFPSFYFDGSLDELEIFKRELTATEVWDLFVADDGGKCREACYTSRLATCCTNNAANASVTICNYSTVGHTYSWGLAPLSGGAGCVGTGAQYFSPPNGTVFVPAQSCVSVPVQIDCPSGIPPGQPACYQVSIYNHTTGDIFGCTGSVRRPNWWCAKIIHTNDDLIDGLAEFAPGLVKTVKVKFIHVPIFPTPTGIDFTVRTFDGDDDGSGVLPGPGTNVSLDGLPPGEPVVRTVPLPPGQTELEVDLTIEVLEHNAFDMTRIVVETDDDMDGVEEPVAEIAVKSDLSQVSGVGDGGVDEGGVTPGPFLALPNPFSAQANIAFRVEKAGPVTLHAYDIQGRVVRIFHTKRQMQPGVYEIVWDGKDDRFMSLPAGVYFLKLKSATGTERVKVVLMR